MAQGYRIGVWRGGLPVLSPTDDTASIIAALTGSHDDHLHFYGTRGDNHRWAWIRLAYGMGWNVVSFHTSNIRALVEV